MAKSTTRPALDKAAIATQHETLFDRVRSDTMTRSQAIQALVDMKPRFGDEKAMNVIAQTVVCGRLAGVLRLNNREAAESIIALAPFRPKAKAGAIMRTSFQHKAVNAARVYWSQFVKEAHVIAGYIPVKVRADAGKSRAGAGKGRAPKTPTGASETAELATQGEALIAGKWTTPADCAAYALRARDNVKRALDRNAKRAVGEYASALRAFVDAVNAIKA